MKGHSAGSPQPNRTEHNPLAGMGSSHIELDIAPPSPPGKCDRGGAGLTQRFTFKPGIKSNADLFCSSTRHGCTMYDWLCLTVSDSHGKNCWDLNPVEVDKDLVELANGILLDCPCEHSPRRTEGGASAKKSAQWLKKECPKLCIKPNVCKDPGESTIPSDVNNIIKHLNTIAADNIVGRLPCMMKFMGLAPFKKDEHGNLTDQSLVFTSNDQRLTIREGECVLSNRNPHMVFMRRLCLWVIATVIAVLFITGSYAVFHGDGETWLKTGLAAFVAVFFCVCLSAVCNSTFCKHVGFCGITSHMKIWLRVSKDTVSFYYEHRHMIDGHPPEAAMFILPGFAILPPTAGCVGCLTACTGCLAQYDFTLRTIDDEWTLSFSGAMERDMWKSAIKRAMRAAGLKKGSKETFLRQAKPACESPVRRFLTNQSSE